MTRALPITAWQYQGGITRHRVARGKTMEWKNYEYWECNMKVEHLSIHNFRGIIDASMEFHSYALVVGANNSGKSTIVDCIRAFYEKDGFKFKKETDFPLKGAEDQESWMELTFSLTDEEHDSLKDEYKTGDKDEKIISPKKIRNRKIRNQNT